MSNNPETTKKGGVSAFDFFCIGFGAIVGVGWAVSINGWMAGSGGPLPASLGYVVNLVLMIPVALCYCELCPMLPVAGGGAAYAYRAFGEKMSFISGWAAFGGFVTIIPWEAIQICDVLSILFPGLMAGEPLYRLAGGDVYIGHIVLGTVFSIVLFAINWRGLSSSAMLQRVLCVILVAGGVIAAIAALTHFNIDNLQPVYQSVGKGTSKSFAGGVLAIMASAPFFLAGFETIPQGVEDAGGDVSSVGKTVVLSVGMACIFYAILLFCLGAGMPWQDFTGTYAADGTHLGGLANPAAANMMRVIFNGGAVGNVLYYIILIGAVCGLFTTWNGFLAASPRLMMSMARSNMLPKWFAKENPNNGVPTNSLIACLILSLVGPFLGAGMIGYLTSFSAAGFVLSWCITSFCVVRLRKKEPDLERPYKIPGGSITAWFGGIVMAIVFVLLFVPGNPVFMGKTAIIVFIGWMVVGVLLFLFAGGERSKLTPKERFDNMFATMKKD